VETVTRSSSHSPTRSTRNRRASAWYVADAMLEDEADGELVRRIVSGGARGAEAELCRRFAPRARLYGLRHLHDEDRASDLVQAVLLAVLEAVRAGRVEDPDRIDRFVLGTCRNVAFRAREVEERARPTDPSELDVTSFTPDLERIETGALVRCLAALNVRARMIVMLSFRGEASTDEIAVRFDTSAGNVRVLRHRAVADLRRCLDECTDVAR
jgi:RNA polymerase sigma-70 factor (ECF subfamily)